LSEPPQVLIPVNRLDRAKGRLAEVLTPSQRVELAKATLSTVLGAVLQSGYPLAVLTSDDAVLALLPAGTRLIREAPDVSGLNPQLEYAVRQLGVERLLILHADLPIATTSALEAFVSAAPPAPSCTIVRSPDGGTNAMLLQPPGRFALAYGRDSAALHEAAARAAGFDFCAVPSPGLELDLDTPADLETLVHEKAGQETPTGRLLLYWKAER
jgi:2-phospho-L-lactate/phosphoenolpyruvate guanylyltransferase